MCVNWMLETSKLEVVLNVRNTAKNYLELLAERPCSSPEERDGGWITMERS